MHPLDKAIHLTRREFFTSAASGLGLLALSSMLQRDGLRSLDPLPSATEGFNRRLQRDMRSMVFSGGCDAWYTDKDDYNFTLWPYSAFRYVFELARPIRREFRAE